MTQSILHDLDVHSSFAHSGGKCMPERVTAKVRKKHRVLLSLQEYGIVAIPDDPANGFIQRTLMLGCSIAVDKDEIGITIYRRFTLDAQSLLVVPLHDESFLDKIQHRHLPLFRLEHMGLFQFLQNIFGGIVADIIVIHGHVQHLIQHRVNTVNRGCLQSPFISQVIVESLHIGLLPC